jgi:hypothetical protein
VSDSFHGKPLPDRIRLGPTDVDRYLAVRAGGLAYMRRLRAIEDEEARQLLRLEEAWLALAEETTDDGFAPAWREAVAGWSFRRLNALVASHNAYYPIEARIPMNPRTGGYARSWRREQYGEAWILERFPPLRGRALELARADESEHVPQ